MTEVVTRRAVVLYLTALPGIVAANAAATDVDRSPEAYGARGDGTTDDTAALQRWLDKAPPGTEMVLTGGRVYRIDTAWQPSFGNYGGLKIRSGQVLRMNGAELHALPSSHPEGAIIQANRTHAWRIVGPGKLVGERMAHVGAGGEWGMGIAAWGASDWSVTGGVAIAECWGDGIMVGSAPGIVGTFCERFVIDKISVQDCRRNGISIVAGRNGTVSRSDIRSISGTSPGAGIDLEPDDGRWPNQNINLTGIRIAEANIGIGVTVGNHHVTISHCHIDAGNSGVMIGDGAQDLKIIDNPMISTRQGGIEGGAVRTAAVNNTTINKVSISRNNLMGGGVFVIDFAAGAQGVMVTNNKIVASNRNARIARLFDGSNFIGNNCVVSSNAGALGGFTVQLVGTKFGNNIFKNYSPFKMENLLIRSKHK